MTECNCPAINSSECICKPIFQKQKNKLEKKSDGYLISMLNYEVSILQRKVENLEKMIESIKMELNRINTRTS